MSENQSADQEITTVTDETQENIGFEQMDLSKEILRAVKAMGFTEPSTVQKKTIPLMMGGADINAIAPTGTGKTVAFGIPMLEYVQLDDQRVQEIVLAPTRELAIQIGEELTQLAKFIKGVRIAVLYGGQSISKQISLLKRNPQIVIATPGRLLDHMNRKNITLRAVHTMVLDEADEMLNMGFVKDVTKIIECTPPDRQLVLFSATTNQDVLTIAWKYQHEPVEVTVEAKKEDRPQITQYVIKTEAMRKMDDLLYLLDSNEYSRIMIFTNTKFMADRVTSRLKKEGYDVDVIHGDIRQSVRSETMQRFKRGKFPILIATDVAARGIDVDDVEAVINFDLPQENEYYLHRIGRTGRAHKHGVSFSLITFQDTVRMDEILRYMISTPTPLHFQDGILLREDGSTFFENV
ncbi:MAG: DEAD/DEAH box helicase [Clostridia bacterium]|nr:DEAD/DEAH box helicase [Clostridia bacterium]